MCGANCAKIALLIAEMPKTKLTHPSRGGRKQVDPWQKFLNEVNLISKDEGTKQIHQNFWEIDLQTGMRTLCELFLAGDRLGIPMRVLFVREAPEWLIYPERYVVSRHTGPDGSSIVVYSPIDPASVTGPPPQGKKDKK